MRSWKVTNHNGTLLGEFLSEKNARAEAHEYHAQTSNAAHIEEVQSRPKADATRRATDRTIDALEAAQHQLRDLLERYTYSESQQGNVGAAIDFVDGAIDAMLSVHQTNGPQPKMQEERP